MILELIKVFVKRLKKKIKLKLYFNGIKIIERQKKRRKAQKSSARNIRY